MPDYVEELRIVERHEDASWRSHPLDGDPDFTYDLVERYRELSRGRPLLAAWSIYGVRYLAALGADGIGGDVCVEPDREVPEGAWEEPITLAGGLARGSRELLAAAFGPGAVDDLEAQLEWEDLCELHESRLVSSAHRDALAELFARAGVTARAFWDPEGNVVLFDAGRARTITVHPEPQRAWKTFFEPLVGDRSVAETYEWLFALPIEPERAGDETVEREAMDDARAAAIRDAYVREWVVPLAEAVFALRPDAASVVFAIGLYFDGFDLLQPWDGSLAALESGYCPAFVVCDRADPRWPACALVESNPIHEGDPDVEFPEVTQRALLEAAAARAEAGGADRRRWLNDAGAFEAFEPYTGVAIDVPDEHLDSMLGTHRPYAVVRRESDGLSLEIVGEAAARPTSWSLRSVDEAAIEADRPTLLFFTAGWSSFDADTADVASILAGELGDRVGVQVVDVDAHAALAARFDSANRVPTTVLVRRGRELGRLIGWQPLGALRAFVGDHL